MYACCDERRREAVREHPALNGIDFLEVVDGPHLSAADRQRKLQVHFLNAHGLGDLKPRNFRVSGGERIRGIEIVKVTLAPDDNHVVVVEVNVAGDFSIYSLHLIADGDHAEPPPNFDPELAEVDFSFKVECAGDFDCLPSCASAPPLDPTPDIDYLAKDYASFRQLMLDRLSTTLPHWTERSPADVGVVLVETLAYVADHLSYRQDAIATEASLGTARRRISVRRHARLVDYVLDDGCNARAWVQVRVGADNVRLPQGTQLLTRLATFPTRIPRPETSPTLERAFHQRPEVFETLHAALLFPSHNEIRFYAAGNHDCRLPQGATRAVLRDHAQHEQRLRLRVGDVLVLEERIGPRTGRAGDAANGHRHAVRLTRVHPEATSVVQDGREVGRTPGPFVTDPLNGEALVDIEWSVDDALPFVLCLSGFADGEHGGTRLDDVSLALGNIVLVDHGRTIQEELTAVPSPNPSLVRTASPTCCADETQGDAALPTRLSTPARFRPVLQSRPLTQAATVRAVPSNPGESVGRQVSFDPRASAAAAFRWTNEQVMPAIRLQPGDWGPQRELLSSDPLTRHFVVELETDGTAQLRFGDGLNGQRPATGLEFIAHYRVGNGVAGNVGAEAIAHVVSDDPAIEGVRNPIAARGGVEPESLERARLNAPVAFRRQERAVTEQDYADVAERHPGVQRAAATLRWTGSWHTVFVTIDRISGLPVDDAFKQDLRAHLEKFRMAGHDLEVDGPRFVSLDIELQVCVRPEFFRSSVQAALLDVFSNRILADGRRGVFHPDNFSFGQPVFLSRLYAAAQEVAGVADVRVTKFERQGRPGDEGLKQGQLKLDRLEIARLDNNPNHREHGEFRLVLGGGK